MRNNWVFLALGILAADQAVAQDKTWLGGTADWNTGSNWSGVPANTKPGTADTAILGALSNQAITNAAVQNTGGIRIDSPGFSLDNTASVFRLSGFGISGTQSFTITNSGAASVTRFSSNATAGQVLITNSGTDSQTQFINFASAGQATITNSGTNALTLFAEEASADQATITNSGANSQAQFFGDSSAGQATITNNHATSVATFLTNSSAENATLILNDGFLNLDSRTSTLKVGSLTGSSSSVVRIFGAVNNPATLSVGYLNQNETFAGRFRDGANIVQVLSLTKEGTGTFVVTNAGHTYTGDTTVNNGTLQWDGGFGGPASDFTINPLGTLTGFNNAGGAIGDLINNGFVAPGNAGAPFGSLRVNSYGTGTGGTLRFRIAPTQNSFLSISTGATLTNTSCDLVFTPGRYKNTSHTLISQNAFGGLNGIFSAITGTPIRLNIFVEYKTVAPRHAILHTSERPFIDVLRTFFNNGNADQRSLAGALDIAAGNPNISSDFNTVLGLFSVLPEGNFLRAMDSVGSDHFNQQTHSDFYTMEMITGLVTPAGSWSPAGGMNFGMNKNFASHAPKGSLDRHALHARENGGFEQAALALKHKHGTAMRDSVRNLLSHNPGKGHIWLQGFGGKVSGETTREDLGFSANTAGVMMGLDYAVCADLRMGVAGGYSHTNMDVNRALGHSSNESPFGSIWANYQRGLMDYDFGFTAKRNSIDNKRNITVLTLNRTATAHYKGYDMVPHLGIARHYWIHEDKLHIKSFASVDLFYNHAEGFTETGANSLNLKVKERNSSLLQSSIGMGFDRHIHWCTGTIKPEIAVKYMNRAVLRRPRTQANFVDQNAFFVSTGDDDMKHRLGLNAEVSYVWKNGGTFKLGYHGDYGKGQHSHMGLISLGKSW